MTFMKNALLAVCILAPLFGLLSTMIVTGRMSFFSDALGHSGFTGIAIGVLCGSLQPTVWAVALAAAFALLFSFVRSRSRQSADTIIGVFPPRRSRSAFSSRRSAETASQIQSLLDRRYPLGHAGRNRKTRACAAGRAAFVGFRGKPAVS